MKAQDIIQINKDMEKPKCEKCIAEGKKYTVYVPMCGTTTLLAYIPAYWDEDGNYIQNKNPNTTTYTYTCSNGHTFSESN